ncbi:ABC transporter substrate-binding protein [Leptospira sp. 96542]|nr:ABC transporter substrate-binding protein [Leptospira sp. 96542]
MRTLSLIFILLSLTFCQEKTRDFDLKIALLSDPQSLDPIALNDLTAQKVAKWIHKGLYHWKDGAIKTDWVKKHSIAQYKEFQLVIFELKPDAPKPNIIARSIKRLLIESFPRKNDYDFLLGVSTGNRSVHLKIRNNISESTWKEKLALPFASIIQFKEDGTWESLGDYRLVEWKKNEYIDIKRNNPNSSDLPTEVRFLILPQATTALFLYRKQKLDVFKLTDFLLNLPEANEKNTIIKKGRSVQYVAINHNNKCFDQNFRLALNFAIPRELIIEKLLGSAADLTYGAIPIPYFTLKFPGSEYKTYVYDKNKAIQYLKSSVCYPNILKSEIEFRMRADEENQTKGRAIIQALRELGLTIKLKPMEKASLYKENGEGKGDLTLLTWYSDYDSIWNFLDPLFHSEKFGNSGNRSFYINKNLTKKFETKNDSEALQTITTIYNEVPWIFLWSIQENYLVSNEFLRFVGLSDYL